jgi:TRAP-type C4-dicarboxylate transport system permease large subunit
LVGVPGICVLLFLMAGLGEHLHGRVLQIGQAIWPEYTALRIQSESPGCDIHRDIEQALQQLKIQAEQEFALAEADGLGADEFNEAAARRSLEATQLACQQQHQQFAQVEAQRNLAVALYAGLEKNLGGFVAWIFDGQRILLMLMVLLCSVYASLHGDHIAFRKPVSRLDRSIALTLQLVTNGLLLFSTWRYQFDVAREGLQVQHPALVKVVLCGLALLCVTNLIQLLNVFRFKTTEPSNSSPSNVNSLTRWPQALLSVPLYAYMGLAAGVYFLLIEKHPAGLAIFFSQILEQADVFLKIALYIWLGMLIKNSRVGESVFALIHSLHLPTTLMLMAVLACMAYPTAYTGASGVVILAFGAVVYHQLRLAGTRQSLALATTAMSGSVGVILSPCLLVVLIAALNKEVVTDELYDWGRWVFVLTLMVFAVVLKLSPKPVKATSELSAHPVQLPRAAMDWQVIGQTALPLVGYVAVLVGSLLIYLQVFDVTFDEISAPIVLPVAVIAILFYENYRQKRRIQSSAVAHTHPTEQVQPVFSQLVEGLQSATPHIGALIMLMGLSFAMGGVFSRSGLLELLPDVWANPWILMGGLVALLIFLGMIMEPFGAIVLVSTAIAPLAYNNGIAPAHFWMMALVAFELGYLTPPIALNHLLTRQVVGEAAMIISSPGQTWWQRYEHFLLPIITMTIVLLLVAFMPLVWQGRG